MAECIVTVCSLPARTLGLCGGHYTRSRRGGDMTTPLAARSTQGSLCSFDGCDMPHHSRGLCNTHAWQRDRVGVLTPIKPRGEWQVLERDGYVVRYESGRTIFQHREVMEQAIGRALESHENVHHLNGDRQDNRLENLELWSRSQPAGQRIEDKVAWAVQILEQYAPARLSKVVSADG